MTSRAGRRSGAAAAALWLGSGLASVLVGCQGAGDSQASAEAAGGAAGTELATRQIYRKSIGAEPESLDPHRAEGVTATDVLRDLFEGLTTETADGAIRPGASDRWVVSPDGLTYTFHIRNGARWSNGDPVTAQDFEFSFRRSANPATLSPYSTVLYPVENAEAVIDGRLPPEALGVRALDAATFEIRLKDPTPYLFGLLAHPTSYPVHPPSVRRYGLRFAKPGTLIGNGAYRLAEWTVQSHMRLVRNEFYWDKARTRISEIWMYPLANADSELKRYRAGEIDFTYSLPLRQLPWLRENFSQDLRLAPYLGSYYYNFNLTKPPFKDNPKLRRALSLAIDRDILTKRVMASGETPAYGWIPQAANYRGYRPAWADWPQEERNREARRLYADSGYTIDRPLEIEILYNTDPNHQRLAAAIASMWKETLGVRATLLSQEWKVFLETRHAKRVTQFVRGGWIGDYNDAFSFAQVLHSKSGHNDPGYDNPEYDRLLALAAREGDPARREELLLAAERVLIDDMPIMPIYFYVSHHLIRPWIGGYRDNIMDHHATRDLYILKH
jgi:oligopeptide transport system substrate-binding protein